MTDRDDVPPDFLAHLRTESDRFVEVLRDADPAAPVPSCPDWDAGDLLWHLAGVQWFWGTVVAERRTSPEGLEEPPRPDSYAGLLEAFDEHSTRLSLVLAEAEPSTEVYTWADDRTVAFIRRRQAHEALIHRLDAELTSGQVTALDPRLAVDGVVEALDVMFGGCPPWGTFTPGEVHVAVVADDVGVTVPVVLGRFTGTDPRSGTAYDEDDLSVRQADPAARPAATVRGRAEDLDAWLWHRRDDAGVTVSGDRAAYERLAAVLSQPIN